MIKHTHNEFTLINFEHPSIPNCSQAIFQLTFQQCHQNERLTYQEIVVQASTLFKFTHKDF